MVLNVLLTLLSFSPHTASYLTPNTDDGSLTRLDNSVADDENSIIVCQNSSSGIVSEIESYYTNPNLYDGPYEFITWIEGLLDLPYTILFDKQAMAGSPPFRAKRIVVHFVGCKLCGHFSLCVYDDVYLEQCHSTGRWWDSEFIRSFCMLTAHQYHNPKVKIVFCFHDNDDEIIDLSSQVTSVLGVVFESSHYVVVEYSISSKRFLIYDGLQYKLHTWTKHCSNIQARCRHPKQPPNLIAGITMRQPDSHNCGPLACLKIFQLFVAGTIHVPCNIGPDTIHVPSNIGPDNCRRFIIAKYKKMLEVNSHHMLLQRIKKKSKATTSLETVLQT